jgi:membrane-bound lytic murein transglycosylase B
MKRVRFVLLIALLTASAPAPAEPHPGAAAFVDRAASEHGFDPAEVTALLQEARYQQSIVDAMKRPAESKPWFEYRPIFLTDRRIRGGVKFWRENRELIDRAANEFGVEPHFIVSIIGVETFYGRITGSYRVLDALATLGFYYPSELARDRSGFFSGELLEFMKLGEEEHLPLTEVTGSYAGAMGMGQFIPSSYRAYAVDFDADGRRDLWRSTPDAVASVANYLHRHGWKTGDPVASRAVINGTVDSGFLANGSYKPAHTLHELAERGFEVGPGLDAQRRAAVLELQERDEPSYWFTFDNFYVITRYNRSPLYAMAVWQLAGEIRAGMSP